MRRLLVVALTAAALVLVPGTAHACTCRQADLATQVADAGNIGVGTVAWTTTNAATTTLTVEFSTVLKGRLGRQEKVRTASAEAACGVEAGPGERYLLFVDGVHGGRLRTSLCSGSAPYSEQRAEQVRALVDQPGELLPTRGSDIVQRKDWFPTWLRWTLAGVVVLLAVGTTALARKPRRPS